MLFWFLMFCCKSALVENFTTWTSRPSNSWLMGLYTTGRMPTLHPVIPYVTWYATIRNVNEPQAWEKQTQVVDMNNDVTTKKKKNTHGWWTIPLSNATPCCIWIWNHIHNGMCNGIQTMESVFWWWPTIGHWATSATRVVWRGHQQNEQCQNTKMCHRLFVDGLCILTIKESWLVCDEQSQVVNFYWLVPRGGGGGSIQG